jgi:GT2 family glycosyltransferase
MSRDTAVAKKDLRADLLPATASENFSIAVIMPAYNAGPHIYRSLSPLLSMKRRGELLEVIVVDDGSTDGTAEIASSLGASVIGTGGRLGPAAARNLGARHASADVLWFVDSDVVPNIDAAQHLRRALYSRDIAAVFGSYDERPAVRNFFSQYKNLLHHHHHQNSEGKVSTFWAGCGAVWRERFLAENGFDAVRYPRPSIEDIEFGYRLCASGAQIRVVPELQATHLKSWTLRSLVNTDLRDRAIPWAWLLLNREGAADDLNVTAAERIRALVSCLSAIFLCASLAGFAPWWLPFMLLLSAFTGNLELFTLFRRRNGVLFALGGLLYHQLYYLYSAATYGACWILHKCEGLPCLSIAHALNQHGRARKSDAIRYVTGRESGG